MTWLIALGARVKGWMIALGAGMAVVVAAFLAGRQSATDRVRAIAAADEARNRERADAAARDAERAGADDRLQRHRF